jgi:hypothetical protein
MNYYHLSLAAKRTALHTFISIVFRQWSRCCSFVFILTETMSRIETRDTPPSGFVCVSAIFLFFPQKNMAMVIDALPW